MDSAKSTYCYKQPGAALEGETQRQSTILCKTYFM
uniref:Uncharacterized protein n=1 Tax=Anguilla anguilla TaxID=7936 RepID=A0A0E9U945_ANGAN